MPKIGAIASREKFWLGPGAVLPELPLLTPIRYTHGLPKSNFPD